MSKAKARADAKRKLTRGKVTPGQSFIIYKRILGFLKPYWKLGLLAVVAMVLAAAAQAAFAWIVQPMVDGTFIEQDPAARRWVPVGLILIFALHGLTSFASEYTVAWVGRNVVKDIRQALFEKYLQLPVAFFDRSSPGMLLAKLTYNVNQIQSAASNAIVVLIRDTFTIIFLVGYMFYLSGWLALVFFGLGPVLASIVNWANHRFRKVARKLQTSVGNFAQIAEDSIRGHTEVKIFGGGDYEADRFNHINEKHRKQQMRYIMVKAMSQPMMQFTAVIALAIILYLATMDVVMETVTPGGLLSFVTAMLLLMPPLKRIVNVNSEIQKALAAGESVFEILDEPPEPDQGTIPLERATGHIEYRDLSFTYKEEDGPVLRDINLEILPGQTVALVGRSGSGKTTLASLLPRFYEPTTGDILLDGRSIREYRLKDLREQIALVGQHVVLFNDTLANNIAYGMRDKPSAVELKDVAIAANALGFIEELPNGFETMIGENGVMLSGGQRQRVAIARALLKNAPILILDEATSALDSESEQLIQDALEQLMRDRTTLVIAHRLSTIEDADKIVVLDKGRIVETGTHNELLALGGHYSVLHGTQFTEA